MSWATSRGCSTHPTDSDGTSTEPDPIERRTDRGRQLHPPRPPRHPGSPGEPRRSAHAAGRSRVRRFHRGSMCAGRRASSCLRHRRRRPEHGPGRHGRVVGVLHRARVTRSSWTSASGPGRQRPRPRRLDDTAVRDVARGTARQPCPGEDLDPGLLFLRSRVRGDGRSDDDRRRAGRGRRHLHDHLLGGQSALVRPCRATQYGVHRGPALDCRDRPGAQSRHPVPRHR